jgi:ferredoxin-NADP reductase
MPQKLLCTVAELIDHGEHVYSLILKSNTPIPRFQPGQFLHLALDAYNHGDFWPESRAFSIASSPSERNFLRITYAVKGKFTHRMEAELHCGSEVWVKLPYGDFIISPKTDVCLLAGGTGITAFTAFLSGFAQVFDHSIYIFYGVRHAKLLIYRALVDSSANRYLNLHPYYFIEEGIDSGSLSGQIDLDKVWKIVPNPDKATYYLSGPPIMLRTLSAGLAEKSLQLEKILTDSWD